METKDSGKIESLISEKDIPYAKRWHPKAISIFESELTSGDFYGMNRELRKNIAYSLQYLQYLQLQLEELNLHSVIEKQLQKTYIITALSIIEGIFSHLVKSKGQQKTSDWDVCTPIHTNILKNDGVEKKYVITEYHKLKTPKEEKMDFEYLITKVQEKKLLEIDYRAFGYLKKLKKIRNKVHLQVSRFENDTDYLGIERYDYLLTRYLLYGIFHSKSFGLPKITAFNFIYPNKEELEELKEYTKRNREKNSD